MHPILLFGLILWAASKRKEKNNRRNDYPMSGRKSVEPRERPQAPSSGRQRRAPGYVDDGVLSHEEALATILLLSLYKEQDATNQQGMLKSMNTRIVAQFNHLMNSTWNMDNAGIYDYLTQQGRQGRYTELGAYALSVNK